jgi:hypothetical protein
MQPTLGSAWFPPEWIVVTSEEERDQKHHFDLPTGRVGNTEIKMDEAERRPLLRSVGDATDKNQDEPSQLSRPPATLFPPSTTEAEENGISQDLKDGSSLRRHSSAHLPPFHESYEPSEEPSSNFAIWTVIPILLLGKLRNRFWVIWTNNF